MPLLDVISVLALVSFIGLLVLFVSIRVGFRSLSDSVDDHGKKLDFHRREQIIHRNRHAKKLNELEEAVFYLNQELEELKQDKHKNKFKRKIKATN